MIKQIHISYKTKDELREIVRLLKEQDYQIYHGLDNIKDDDYIVAICIDNQLKEVFQSSITSMAGLASKGFKPITANDLINNFEALIIKQDISLFCKLSNVSEEYYLSKFDNK